MGFFSPAPARIVSASADEIGRRFRLIRIRQVSIMLLGYALFYVCRLAFSATKKTMIEEGAYTAREIGYVGSALLVAYAIGKLACGFLADRANIRRMFAFGLFVSSLATMTVGFHVPAAMLMVVWFVNGLAQGSGSPCCVVSLARWWPNRSRGTFYGIWSCSNNLGEAIAYVVTSVIMVRVGLAYGADMAWRSGFWGAATFGFIGVALISLFMRDSPQAEGLPSVAEWEGEIKGEEEKGESRRIIRVENGGDVAYVSWQQAIEALKYHVDTMLKLYWMQAQIPDISFENMKGLGNIGFDARQTLLTDAHLKIGDEAGVWLEFLERENNVIKAFLKLMNKNFGDEVDNVSVEHVITPFIQNDELAEINKRMKANGGKAIESQLESIQKYGQSDDAQATLEQIQAEEKVASDLRANAFSLGEQVM